MTEPLMIGACGWQHAVWAGSYYPDELPDDWRFCFYSNNLRSVLVPGDTWRSTARTDVEQWLTDSDPSFRFVLELPPGLSSPQPHGKRDRGLDYFFEVVEPILPRTAGLLLRIAPETPVFIDWFEHLLNELARTGPLCVDLPQPAWREAPVLAAVERQQAGVAWYCELEPVPRAGGKLLVARATAADARSTRAWIEKLAQWLVHDPAARAGLFFEASETSAKAAQEARILAELMGV